MIGLDPLYFGSAFERNIELIPENHVLIPFISGLHSNVILVKNAK